MLLGASIYYVARRALHAACCPSYPASCLVRAAWCTRAVKYLPASSGGLPLPLDRRLVGLVRRRAACQCIGRRAAVPARSPRRGRRRDSVGGRGGIQPPAQLLVLGRQRPSEPQYPAASPQRHGTPQRHVIPRRHGIPQRFGISQRHGMPWDGFDRSCHIRGRTSDVERGSTGNGCGRERAMRAHGCPCSSSGCNNRMSTETTIW
jgi:hypothetical protein